MGFMAVFVVLWILSLAGVRGRMATRAWESGDVERAHRLASLATRQKPELADMWLLQGRCETHLQSPCAAALSYTRAALAATEQLGEQSSRLLAANGTGDDARETSKPASGNDVDTLRETAIQDALTAAAQCGSVSTIASVFEALTIGIPSSPENRSGIWPGDPGVAGHRPTAETLANALPADPELRFQWIEFFWRRQRLNAAVVAAEQLGPYQDTLPASGLWLIGRTLLSSGKGPEAVAAFQQALHNDPGWVPAAVTLATLEATGDAAQPWERQPLALESARVEADVFDARPDVLLLATNGSVTFEVSPARGAGRVFLTVDVRGTPAHGRFPEVSVFVNGARVAGLEATDVALPVVVELPPSLAETIAVSFVFGNDWADETGDRNVFFSGPALFAGTIPRDESGAQ